MGMIASTTPKTKIYPIVNRYKSCEIDFKKLAQVDIVQYENCKKMLKDINFCQLPIHSFTHQIGRLSLLWQISSSVKPEANWSGTMQVIYSKSDVSHPGKSSVFFLPIIDMAAGDMTCSLSTLTYLNKVACDRNVPCVITFDQPLFWKASQIINKYTELQDIVLMLGTFHTLMNVLGGIGNIITLNNEQSDSEEDN